MTYVLLFLLSQCHIFINFEKQDQTYYMPKGFKPNKQRRTETT